MGKAFETKLIKEGSKIPNWHLKATQVTKKLEHALPIYNCPYLPQHIHCLHSQQYRPYHDFKQEEVLNKEVLQDHSRIRNNSSYLTTNPKPCQVS